jgi:hypothetical protein
MEGGGVKSGRYAGHTASNSDCSSDRSTIRMLGLMFVSLGTGSSNSRLCKACKTEGGSREYGIFDLYAAPMHLPGGFEFLLRWRYPGGHSTSSEYETDMLCYLLDSNYMDTFRSRSIQGLPTAYALVRSIDLN